MIKHWRVYTEGFWSPHPCPYSSPRKTANFLWSCSEQTDHSDNFQSSLSVSTIPWLWEGLASMQHPCKTWTSGKTLHTVQQDNEALITSVQESPALPGWNHMCHHFYWLGVQILNVPLQNAVKLKMHREGRLLVKEYSWLRFTSSSKKGSRQKGVGWARDSGATIHKGLSTIKINLYWTQWNAAGTANSLFPCFPLIPSKRLWLKTFLICTLDRSKVFWISSAKSAGF